MNLIHRSLPYLLSLCAVTMGFIIFENHRQAQATLLDSVPEVVEDAPADSRQATGPAVVSLTRVQSWQLFGQIESGPVDQPAAPVEQAVIVTESRLSLKLLGVFAPADENKGHAIIAGSTNGKHFEVGDELASGVTLQAIHTDRVTINNRGQREFLLLPKLNRSNPAASANPPRQRFQRQIAADQPN